MIDRERGGEKERSDSMGRKEQETSDQDQPWKGRDQSWISPGFVFLGLFGAAAATASKGKWNRTVNWYSAQLWRAGFYFRFWTNVSGRNEAAWARYRRRVREMQEDERERVERIRRMQEVFNRERNKRMRGPEAWTDHGTGCGCHQQFQREDWYYKTEYQNSNQRTNYRSAPIHNVNHAKSHHYSILGLDRNRSEPYSDAELKSAFRKKALEFHPDHNQTNSAMAEAKFKEVVASYEAIQLERKRSC
ncbi:Chaperone protein DnaJ [Rhynchospora pubera]|uniref:Chaperone protein DnaJ n=1 Tax=Rhynchospora pubera TaxID=906938 RepID=A0AAV8D0L0_9POAL|nr:Chaperone protein DnaJ [Rhynchospora pubera]